MQFKDKTNSEYLWVKELLKTKRLFEETNLNYNHIETWYEIKTQAKRLKSMKSKLLKKVLNKTCIKANLKFQTP